MVMDLPTALNNGFARPLARIKLDISSAKVTGSRRKCRLESVTNGVGGVGWGLLASCRAFKIKFIRYT